MAEMDADYDVVVAGGGIAGLCAGLTAARLGRRTLVLTGGILGGQLLSIARVDGYPGFPDGVAGYDLCPMAQEAAVAAGAEIAPVELARLAAEEGLWRVTAEDGASHRARGVVIATGAAPKELGVAGEARLMGKGVSHCATCDGPLLRGRTAAVVGGGDSAAQEALTLADYDARVVLIHRGPALRAQATYRDKVLAHPKIEVRLDTTVEEICGEEAVASLRLRGPGAATGGLETAAVFVYIGLRPATGVVAGVAALDAGGAVVVDAELRCARPGLAAAGAARAGWAGRAASSAGDGAAAAMAVERYLRDGVWP